MQTEHITYSLSLGRLDYKKHRATPTRLDPVDGMRCRMSFQPELESGLVICCKWSVLLMSRDVAPEDIGYE